MKCAWQAYLNILPNWMRSEVDQYGGEGLQELRIRTDLQPELVSAHGGYTLSRRATKEDITFIINVASSYSPWTAQTARDGYISVLTVL